MTTAHAHRGLIDSALQMQFIAYGYCSAYYIHTFCSIYCYCGPQVYDITSKSSDWWFARLARDTKPDGAALGKQGWVPSSFLEKFTKSLSPDEEAAYWIGMCIIIV